MDRIDTVDVAVLSQGRIVLIERAKPPFMEKLVLPGGHVEEGEDPRMAAVRELKEEIGLVVETSDLVFLLTLDAPGRDPRGQKVSQVFTVMVEAATLATCTAGSDAKRLVMREVTSITSDEIGFDHYKVIEALKAKGDMS